MENKELTQEHQKALSSIRDSANAMIQRINSIRNVGKGKLSKKDKENVCVGLINNFILPMENAMLNLYIDANGLRHLFPASVESKEEKTVA